MAVPASVIMKKTVGNIGGSNSSSGPVLVGKGNGTGTIGGVTLPPEIWWVEVILAVVIFLVIRALWSKL